MANEKRMVYVEDVIALFEKDIAESKDALKTAFYGDKEEIRAEMNGVRAALCILKHHASHGGTVDAVEVVHGRWEQNGNFLMCSECYDLYKEREATVFCYCPNCGAKMDGDGNGTT